MATVTDLAALSDNCYEDRSTGLGQWTRVQDAAPFGGLTGFFGAAYVGGAAVQELVIAFRGSERPGKDFVRDWVVNDLAIGSRCVPIIQVAEAEVFARTLVGMFGDRMKCYITGHSLGGALAQIVAGNLSGTVGLSFNARGVKSHLWALIRSWSNDASVWNIRADGDPVSKFGEHVGHRPLTVGSSGASMADVLTVFQAVNRGMFVGLQTGVPQLALMTGIAAGALSAKDVVAKAGAAHVMGAIYAGLKDNPKIANSVPEGLPD